MPIDPLVQARAVAARAFSRATTAEASASLRDDFDDLRDSGLLVAPLDSAAGGADLLRPDAVERLAVVLATIGWGSLPLGRLYEGHVNALKFVALYGTPAQRRRFAADAAAGCVFAVWNTEAAGEGMTIARTGEGYRLQGRKILASGAGALERPLITARDEAGDLRMVICPVTRGTRADLAAWQPLGMRATESGALDFTGLVVDDGCLIGGADDFHRQPGFSAGAWRFAAVQSGGIARLFEAARDHLVSLGRADDPHQLARMGTAAIAVEGARQWVGAAARLAEDATATADAKVAFVNLARTAVERAGLDVLEAVHRSVGLSGLMQGHPVERLSRDLMTYLRQPAPDRALTEGARYVMAQPGAFAQTFA